MPTFPKLDARLLNIRHYDTPVVPRAYKTKAEWLKRAAYLRDQLKLALGLWPEPPRGDLNPVVSGRTERDGYSIENVRFEASPGFFVTGNLYRPHPLPERKLAALLVPHGHWPEGRLVNYGPENDSMPGLCINVAQRGMAAFAIDMIGYNDSCQINHQYGKDKPEEHALWGLSLMGLQAFNATRSVDFLLSLPEVDPKRIAVTGASGGGTQTFILAALDERIALTAPAVMVSSTMQGGCLCENAPALRFDTDNMEIAGLAAPRPQLLISCTGDWTSNTPKVEAPAVTALYKLQNVKQLPVNYHQHADHNYNRRSREALYTFLAARGFLNGSGEVKENEFTVESNDKLRIFPDRKPPAGGKNDASLTAYRKEVATAWLEARRPKDAAGLKRLRGEVLPLLKQVLHAQAVEPRDIQVRSVTLKAQKGHTTFTRLWFNRKGTGELCHGVLVRPATAAKKAPLVIAVHSQGSFRIINPADLDCSGPAPAGRNFKSTPHPTPAEAFFERGACVLALDIFEATPLFGARARTATQDLAYNVPSLCNRVQDILTALGWARGQKEFSKVLLAGYGWAGAWTLLARALGTGVAKTLADTDGMNTAEDEDYVWRAFAPGLRLAGGLPAAAALCAPAALCLHGTQGRFDAAWAREAYAAASKPESFELHEARLSAYEQAAWLLGG